MAGQSVPHVHVHLIPRHPTDYQGDNDQIYPALEAHEQELGSVLESSSSSESSAIPSPFPTDQGSKSGSAVTAPTTGSGAAGKSEWRIPKDEERRSRSMGEMETEAKWLASLFT